MKKSAYLCLALKQLTLLGITHTFDERANIFHNMHVVLPITKTNLCHGIQQIYPVTWCEDSLFRVYRQFNRIKWTFTHTQKLKQDINYT